MKSQLLRSRGTVIVGAPANSPTKPSRKPETLDAAFTEPMEAEGECEPSRTWKLDSERFGGSQVPGILLRNITVWGQRAVWVYGFRV